MPPRAFLVFLVGHLPQTFSFHSAKEILVVSFATQPWAFILSDRNIFYTPGGGRTTAGSNAPGAFLVSYDVLFNSLVQQTIKFNHQIRNDCASCAVFFVYESKADALISVAPSVF